MRLRMFASSAVAALLVLGTGPAAAQSFFEALFGWSKPNTVAPPPAATSGRLPATTTYRVPPSTSYSRPDVQRDADEDQFSDGDDLKPVKTGRLRAVCVRLCDGFYWPLNDRASRQTLKREAERCQATCGTEARLFYQDRESPDPARLVDLAGNSYDSLKTAYLYRKKLISGCGCKPAPWSEAEMGRHRGYAIAQALAEQAKTAKLADAAKTPVATATARAEAKATADAATADAPLTRWPDAIVVAAIAEATPTPVEGESSTDTGERSTQPVATLESNVSEAAVAILAARSSAARSYRVSRSAQPGRAVKPVDPRVRQARQPRLPAQVRPQKVAVSSAGFSGLGFGKPKYVWPGDR